MREIVLTANKKFSSMHKKYSVMVDDEDYDALIKYKWQAKKHGQTVYARGIIDKVSGKMVYMHRFILGVTDKSLEVDHMDNNGLNNQKGNLRICGHDMNGKNRNINKNKKTKYKGVTEQRPGKFQCRITLNKKQIQLGYYNNEEDAAKAYNEAAIKYHGEYARLNILPEYKKITL